MSNICPKGHFSSDSDYCSDCGTPMKMATHKPGTHSAPVVPTSSSSTGVGGGSDRCPDCGCVQPSGARFCEVCRFDFQTQSSYSGVSAPAPHPGVMPHAPQATPAAPTIATAVPMQAVVEPTLTIPQRSAIAPRLLLRIVVDATLNTEPDPALPCPEKAPQRIFHLDLQENTLGRQFEGKGLHPEIVVPDTGISRRHLKFVRDDDGHFSVLELGSANGTQFNGKVLEAGVVTPIQPGDQFTLGMWTRVHVEER